MKKYLTLFFFLGMISTYAQTDSFDYSDPDAFVEQFITDMKNGYVRQMNQSFLIDDHKDRLTMKLLGSRLAKEGKELDIDDLKAHYAEYFQMPKSLLNITFLKRDPLENDEYALLEDISEENYQQNELAKKYYPTYTDYRKHRIEAIGKKIKYEVVSAKLIRHYEKLPTITYIYEVKAVEGDYLYLIVVVKSNEEWNVAAMFNYKSTK